MTSTNVDSPVFYFNYSYWNFSSKLNFLGTRRTRGLIGVKMVNSRVKAVGLNQPERNLQKIAKKSIEEFKKRAEVVQNEIEQLINNYFGVTKFVSKSKTLVSLNDEMAKLPFWVSRDKAFVSGVDDHDSYLLSANVSQEIREFLEVK